MRHEGGLYKLGTQLKNEDTHTQNIKKNSIRRIIEGETPGWTNAGPRLYHAWTRDWISNEIFRRVEPQGRTMGEYSKQELNAKLGPNSFVIGCTDHDLKRVVRYNTPKKETMFELLQEGKEEGIYLLDLDEMPDFL